MQITSLWRYPVKSVGGSPESALEIEPWGPTGDRRWALVDPDGERVSAREAPALLLLSAVATPGGGVVVNAPSGDAVEVAPPYDGPLVPVGISGVGHAREAGDPAAAFFSAALGTQVRLVWQEDPRGRGINPGNGGLPGEVLTLADAGPLLLTSESSLARLQEWVGAEPQLSMRRFRPNVVVDGDEPFAEDNWSSVRLGEMDYRVQQACDRCVMTTIDPETSTKGPEPIRTLARHRRWDGKTWFGIWLVPVGTGKIHLGDAVVAA